MTSIPPWLTLKLVVAIACALLVALLIHDRNRWKATATLRQQQVVAEKAAHLATVSNYRAAAEQARAADLANLARTKADQAAINERTANEFESRIAAARARADRLRLDARAETDPRGRRTAPVPGVSASAQGTAQAAGENRLSSTDALIATEQAIQLDELIKWVRQQHAVRLDSANGVGGQAAADSSD
jgi:hypothetical protein